MRNRLHAPHEHHTAQSDFTLSERVFHWLPSVFGRRRYRAFDELRESAAHYSRRVCLDRQIPTSLWVAVRNEADAIEVRARQRASEQKFGVSNAVASLRSLLADLSPACSRHGGVNSAIGRIPVPVISTLPSSPLEIPPGIAADVQRWAVEDAARRDSVIHRSVRMSPGRGNGIP